LACITSNCGSIPSFSATPAEGADSVPLSTNAIVLRFNQPMSRQLNAPLFEVYAGGLRTTETLGDPAFSDGDKTLTFAVLTPFRADTEYRVVLNGYFDEHLTPLDGVPYLGDSVLNFTTEVPGARIEASVPTDGAVDVDAFLSQIFVDFGESMAPDAGTATLTGGDAIVLSTIWSGSQINSAAYFNIVSGGQPLAYTTLYTLTLTGFKSATGVDMPTSTLRFTTAAEVFAPPRVSSTDPARHALVDVLIDTIQVTFDQPMNTSTGSGTLLGGAGSVATPAWNGAVATFTISGGPLTATTDYRLNLSGFKSANGTELGGYELNFRTGFADTAPPTLVNTTPTNHSAAESLTGPKTITLTFNEPMKTTFGTLTLDDTTLGSLGAPAWRDGNRVVDYVLTGGPWHPSQVFSFVIAGYRDRSGNVMESSPTLTFLTAPDRVAPTATVSPAHGATGVARTTSSIVVTFNEEMFHSVGAFNYTPVYRFTGPGMPAGVTALSIGTPSFSPDWKVLTIPIIGGLTGGPLAGSSTYNVTISDFYDAYGGNVMVPLTATFTTAADTTPPVVVASTLPTGTRFPSAFPPRTFLLRFSESMSQVLRNGNGQFVVVAAVSFVGGSGESPIHVDPEVTFRDNNEVLEFTLTTINPPVGFYRFNASLYKDTAGNVMTPVMLEWEVN